MTEWRAWITETPLRHVAAPVYDGLVRAQLAAARLRDRVAPVRRDFDFSDVTALVKTFERPRCRDRILESLHHAYPQLKVVVVDDSRQPRLDARPGVEVVAAPYDVGAAEGRNLGLRRITTDLFLLLDDDHVVTRRTGLEWAVETMRRHPSIDILGGLVLTLPIYRRDINLQDRSADGALVGGLPVFEYVNNFFLGRTARVRELGWDPELKLCEHSDFFFRAKGKLVTVFDPRLRVLHAMTPFDRPYMRKRRDVATYLERLKQKWL
jgi:hypothetical protein